MRTSVKIIISMFIAVAVALTTYLAAYAILGRSDNITYHTGESVGSDTRYVMSSGRTSGNYGLDADTSAEFKTIINQLLNKNRNYYDFDTSRAKSSYDINKDEVGAAFIINTMLGELGTKFSTTAEGVANAKSRYSEWVNRVDRYTSAGCADYTVLNVDLSSTRNSRWGQIPDDDAFYISGADADRDLIRFYELRSDGTCNFSNEIYTIKKNCGNPLGNLKGLKEGDTGWEYDVGVDVPGNQDHGATFDVSSLISNATNNSGPSSVAHGHRILVSKGTDYVIRTDGGPQWANAGNDFDALWQNFSPVGANSDLEHTGSWQIRNDGDYTGEQVCFQGRVYPSIGVGDTSSPDVSKTSVEKCITINSKPKTWDYNARTLSPTTDQSVKPGETITFTSDAENINGSMAGPAYTHTISVEENNDDILNTSDPSEWTGVSIAAGGNTANRSASWTVKPDAPHGTRVCVNAKVTPTFGGESVNTDNGDDWADQRCWTVDNEQYNLNVTITGFNGVEAPGYEFTNINYSVCNNDPISSGAAHGRAPGVTISGSGDFGGGIGGSGININPDNCWENSGNTFTIPADAPVGKQYCTTLTSSKNWGYTNGGAIVTADEPTPVSDTECVTVGIKPYLEVYNGDLWAGANFEDVTQNPSTTPCVSTSNNNAQINSVTNASSGKGSFVEYAAMATGDISGFGSDGRPDWTSLTFANSSTPLGNYADPLCIPDYHGELYGNGTSRGSGAINIQNLANGQHYTPANTNITINSSGLALDGDKNITIVVDGSVYINATGGGNNKINFVDDYRPAPPPGPPPVPPRVLEVPSLIIVARDNIYIDEEIVQIDGILIAHGTVWTCADGFSGIESVSSAVCDEQLTINGSIIANKVNFMRTRGADGGVHSNTSEPAEIINFSPEFFLSDPVLITNNPSELRTVLFRDLPPIY